MNVLYVYTPALEVAAPTVFIYTYICVYMYIYIYRRADKSLARPTSRCIFFDGENISFDASLVIYTYK